jgi:hypothetical protein
VAGNPDVFKEADGEEAYAEGDLKAPGPRGKRRAARTRDGRARDAVSGAPVKHRADRRARGIQKRADGGYTGPYSGASGYVPAAAPIAPGRFTAPAVPNQPDYTSQMINAIGTWAKAIRKTGVKALLAASNCRAARLATRRVMLCKTSAWTRLACRRRAAAWCASAAVMFVRKRSRQENER